MKVHYPDATFKARYSSSRAVIIASIIIEGLILAGFTALLVLIASHLQGDGRILLIVFLSLILLVIVYSLIRTLISLFVLLFGEEYSASVVSVRRNRERVDTPSTHRYTVRFAVNGVEYVNILPDMTKLAQVNAGDKLVVKKLGRAYVIDIDKLKRL